MGKKKKNEENDAQASSEREHDDTLAASNPMRFLSAAASDWIPCAESDEGAEESRARLTDTLSQVLLTENLLVLSGLGTSLCVLDAEGEPAAPRMSDLWDAVRTTTGDDFAKVIELVHYDTSTGEDIEDLLSRCQALREVTDATSREIVERFVEQAEQEIVKLCRFVAPGDQLETHQAFLRKVARRSTRKPRLKLFTTNYDLCFEVAAQQSRFVVIDGFSHTLPQAFDGSYFAYDLVRREAGRETPAYISNVFHLYKLHGSVDWGQEGEQILRSDNPERPVLVYPRHGKFAQSYEPPFIEMMARFQSALREPDTGLVIVGVGFHDQHVWQPLLAAIRLNTSLRVVVIDPNLEASCDREPLTTMRQLIRSRDHRLLFLEATFESAVPLLPDLTPDSEEERHRDRLQGREETDD